MVIAGPYPVLILRRRGSEGILQRGLFFMFLLYLLDITDSLHREFGLGMECMPGNARQYGWMSDGLLCFNL